MHASINFSIFGTNKLHKAANDMVLTYLNSCSPEGATNLGAFSLHYGSFAYS